VSEVNDHQLAARAGAGDLQAFEVLVRRYQLRIYRLCLRMIAERRDAEEAAQDTFLTAWRSMGRFRGESQFSTWLYRIATNRCLKHLQRRPDPAARLPERPSSHGNPEAELDADQQLRATTAAINRLTPEQRAVFLLRHVEAMNYDQIAAVMGITMSAVKSRLNRARVELAGSLEPDR
jgi:RNA polymerase sigma-70 factor (ECF subfamily)